MTDTNNITEMNDEVQDELRDKGSVIIKEVHPGIEERRRRARESIVAVDPLQLRQKTKELVEETSAEPGGYLVRQRMWTREDGEEVSAWAWGKYYNHTDEVCDHTNTWFQTTLNENFDQARWLDPVSVACFLPTVEREFSDVYGPKLEWESRPDAVPGTMYEDPEHGRGYISDRLHNSIGVVFESGRREIRL